MARSTKIVDRGKFHVQINVHLFFLYCMWVNYTLSWLQRDVIAFGYRVVEN